MNVIKYHKLVRDKIPEIIEKSGKKAIIEKLDDKGYIDLLNKKLIEELREFLKSGRVEELADIVEVIYAILDFKKMSVSEFEEIRLDRLINGVPLKKDCY